MSVCRGIKDPLAVAQQAAALQKVLASYGLTLSTSSDMAAFAVAKRKTRGVEPGPMHDRTVCDFSGERGFWTALTMTDGTIVGMQAYRCDFVDINLAEWCSNYMIGVYMRRNELMVPSHAKPPEGSIAWKLRGKLVYHGELWVEKELKSRKVIEMFSRLGALLAFLKWNPDAIWALTGFHMATRGYASRMGYPYIERGFLRWQWHSENVEEVEYLAVAERDFIEQTVAEARDENALSFGLANEPELLKSA